MNEKQLDPKLLAALEVMDSLESRLRQSVKEKGWNEGHVASIGVQEIAVLWEYFKDTHEYGLDPA